MKRQITLVLLAPLFSLAAIDANAVEGRIDSTICANYELLAFPVSDSHVYGTVSGFGSVTDKNPSSPFFNATIHCGGVWSVVQGKLESPGYCSGLTSENDKWMIEYRRSQDTSNWTFLHGTGKWTGISGSGRSGPIPIFPAMRPNLVNTCYPAVGSYRLP